MEIMNRLILSSQMMQKSSLAAADWRPRGEPAKPNGRCCSVSSPGWNDKPTSCVGGSRNGKQTLGASSEMQRMVDWVKAELVGLEEFLDPSKLSRLLHTRNLFPEVDDLVDPLGEPPRRHPWGR